MWRSRGLVECGAGSAERVVTAELLSTEDVADRGDELVGVVGRVDGRLPGSARRADPGWQSGTRWTREWTGASVGGARVLEYQRRSQDNQVRKGIQSSKEGNRVQGTYPSLIGTQGRPAPHPIIPRCRALV